jgi:hypothetical protein
VKRCFFTWRSCKLTWGKFAGVQTVQSLYLSVFRTEILKRKHCGRKIVANERPELTRRIRKHS